MTACDETVSAVLDVLGQDWACRPVGSNVLLLAGSNHYSDGDAVELLVRMGADDAVVSDGGETLNRLQSAGVNLKSGRAQELWTRLTRAHEIQVENDRLIARGSASQLGTLVSLMADAMVNLDGLRLLAPKHRAPQFSEQLVSFLQAEFEFVEERPKVQGHSGSSYRVTAAAGSHDHPVYIQALGGTTQAARMRSYEHGFMVFSDVNRALPPRRKLFVVDESAPTWSLGRLRLLSEVAYVGSWGARERFVDFIGAQSPPEDRLLLDDAEQLEVTIGG